MAFPRIRVARDKAELVQALVEGNGSSSPFQTYADVLTFAAAFGVKRGKRLPLGVISTKEPGPISLEVFISRGYDVAMKLLAIAETKDPKILAISDPNAEAKRIQIFEEYANGGLEQLQEELRGTVDYSEGLLLLLKADKSPEEMATEEFDLSRFL